MLFQKCGEHILRSMRYEIHHHHQRDQIKEQPAMAFGHAPRYIGHESDQHDRNKNPAGAKQDRFDGTG